MSAAVLGSHYRDAGIDMHDPSCTHFSSAQSRQRDLFPLPLPVTSSVARKVLSRGCQQRALRRGKMDELTHDIVYDLNSLYSGQEGASCSTPPASVSTAQWLSLSVIRDAVARFGRPPTDLDGPEALRELRSKAERYCNTIVQEQSTSS